ncbi:DUF2515 family protein [Paenibacillus solani]|uniref:DUF2515 family protein n=1 Tax=Paenibacillus solani TaxID=1705565 RepID=UPI003D2B0AC0
MHSHEGQNRRKQETDRSWTNVISHALAESWNGAFASLRISVKLRTRKQKLPWDRAAVKAIQMKLKEILTTGREREQGLPLNYAYQAEPITEEEQRIVKLIYEETTNANRSNVTRTQAYWDCYVSHPEIHWALLAHMVSRNAGWNMSDLKGGLMSDLTNPKFKNNLYLFLERCNALIFQDAYPQLLLYMHSRKEGKPLFHLLPHFHVSSFMTPFWEQFWQDGGSSLLTIALIINEQNYIEGRVAKHSFYQRHLLHHALFRTHELVRLNQIVFPLGYEYVNNSDMDNTMGQNLPSRPLAGLTLPKFDNLSLRIKAGRSLYALLFGYEEIHRAVLGFAHSTKHQGSRAEYWPALFTSKVDQAMNHAHVSNDLLKSEWLPAGQRLYSPRLEEVWHDESSEPIPRYDWYQDDSMLTHIRKPHRPLLPDMTHAHRAALEKTSIAHDAAARLPPHRH